MPPDSVTVVEALVAPPAPVQLSVKVLAAPSAPVLAEPEVARLPLQPPEAVQEVALVDVQLSVEDPPLATMAGLALKATVGAGMGALTATLALALALPPGPVQLSVNDVVALSAAEVSLPDVTRLPLQPPEAVHAVALVELQFSVIDAPLGTDTALGVSVTVGGEPTLSAPPLLPPPQASRTEVSPVDAYAKTDRGKNRMIGARLMIGQRAGSATGNGRDGRKHKWFRHHEPNAHCLYCAHSRAVPPSHEGLRGVPPTFLSLTSPGRGFKLRYQILLLPSAVDCGALISARMSLTVSSPE